MSNNRTMSKLDNKCDKCGEIIKKYEPFYKDGFSTMCVKCNFKNKLKQL